MKDEDKTLALIFGMICVTLLVIVCEMSSCEKARFKANQAVHELSDPNFMNRR